MNPWPGILFSLFLLGLALASQAQSTVTLVWDQSTNAVAGYYVYQGTNSRGYSSKIDVGKTLQKQISGLTGGKTYFFAVAAYNSARLEGTYSSEISYTPPSDNLLPPSSTGALEIVIPATSGGIVSPFVISNSVVWQTAQTTVTNGGRAAYSFTNSRPGNYVISAQVKAPNTSANSFYVNMDAEPTDPLMTWNIAVSSVFTNQTVSWLGISDSVPKVFYLSAGAHQLIIRGREANTQFGTITLRPAPFQLRAFTNNQVVLSGVALTNSTYDIVTTTNLKTWSVIGSITTDPTGVFSFTDTTAATTPARYYRLRGSPLVNGAPVLAAQRLPNKQIRLSTIGQSSHSYDILASTDLKTWTVIGTATTDALGNLSFTDPAAAAIPMRFYRLRG